MFRGFLSYFNENIGINYTGNLFSDFILQLGGRSFGNGVFNSFSKENVQNWREIVTEAYPDFRDKFVPFGYDWLGRCFGIDLRSSTYGNILMFEIGADDILEICCSFEVFLNKEIPEHADACLADEYYAEWLKQAGKPVTYGRCAGYKTPLFLGGEDSVGNLEDSDMEVYWSILTEIKKTI